MVGWNHSQKAHAMAANDVYTGRKLDFAINQLIGDGVIPESLEDGLKEAIGRQNNPFYNFDTEDIRDWYQNESVVKRANRRVERAANPWMPWSTPKNTSDEPRNRLSIDGNYLSEILELVPAVKQKYDETDFNIPSLNWEGSAGAERAARGGTASLDLYLRVNEFAVQK